MKSLCSIFFVILFCTPFISGCKPQSLKAVEAFTSKILEPVSVTITPDPEIGEILLSDTENEIIVEISNNSSSEIRSVNLDINTDDNLIDFKPTLEGVVAYPGLGGTCGTVIAPGRSCIVKLVMIARKQGEFNIKAKVTYINLIQPQFKNINFHMIAGDPASLVFTNDISNYSLGVFEQTEATERFLDLEVQNAGGLPARNLNISMINDDLSPAYQIVNHNCPTKLDVGKKCNLKLSYTPRNNNYSDPETIFTGHVAFDYNRDPNGNLGHLNGYVSFTSATIEAKFKTNFPNVDFGTVTAGNKEVRTIKLTNQGYREGILKKLIFKFPKPNPTTDALSITECLKGTGTILNCQKNIFDFPFIVEDTNSCLDSEVYGIGSTSSSPNCFFKITYWPSTDYMAGSQALHNFNLATISFYYDSRWKGQNNIITKDGVFELKNSFNAKALLSVYSVKLNNTSILPAKMTNPNKWLEVVNLERLAKLKDNSSHNTLEIRYKNIGEVPATFSILEDGASPTPFAIRATDSFPAFPDPNTARDLNSYYRSVKLSDECISPILPGDTNCTITYDLYPVKQANSLIEDNLMYDNISDLFNKYKIFKFSYLDGGNFEDDGSTSTIRTLETRLVSQLISKGKLVITTNTPLNLGTIVNGDQFESRIKITNGGTGDITAMQFFDAANSFESPKASPFPYSYESYAPGTLPADSQKDCYVLLYSSSTSFPFIPDTNKVLREGESCSLKLTAKAPRSTIDTLINPATTTFNRADFKRFFDHNLNSLEDIWTKAVVASQSGKLKINYWDGDDNSLNDLNSFLTFGYKAVSSVMTINSSFSSPANIGFSNIISFPSAVIYRPATNYPAIAQTVPDTINIPAVNFESRLFTTSNFSNLTTPIIGPSSPCKIGTATFTDNTGSTQSASIRDFSLCEFYTALGAPYTNSNYHMIHLGTFQANQAWSGSITLSNFGVEVPSDITLLADSNAAGLPIKIKKFGGFVLPDPYITPQVVTGSTITMDINVQSAIAGRTERCYDVTYKSKLGNRDLRFCLVADIIAASPKLEISYFNNDATWDSGTASFIYVPDATPTIVSAPQNTGEINPTTTDKMISLSAVVGQPNATTYPSIWNNDKKIIRLKNIGTAALTNINALSSFKIDLVKRSDNTSDAAAKTAFTPPTAAEIAGCLPLAVNATCDLTIYLNPKIVSAADTSDYLLFSYAVADKQFVNQYVALSFEGLATAKAIVKKYQITNSRVWGAAAGTVGQLVSSVNSWVDPSAPPASPVQNSYSLKLGTTATTVHKLAATPTVTTLVLDIDNSTTTKISFLKANPTPAAGTWNQIYPPAGLAAAHNGNKVLIEATRGCFYGDDENNASIASNLKGFNTATTLANKCQFKVTFKGDITYSNCVQSTKAKVTNIGGVLLANCNPYVFDIPFWTFKRSASSVFYTHMEDFIEPSKSSFLANTPNLAIKYLNSTNSEVKFTLPSSLSPLSSGWGNIVKYRILYAADKTRFSSSEMFRYDYNSSDSPQVTFRGGMIMQETSDNTPNITLTQNLANGKYYYVKVLAIRQTPALPGYPSGVYFISDPLIPILTVATPINNNMAYVDALKGFVDKTALNNNIYSQTTALSACSAVTFNINNAGTNIVQRKQLIGTNEFQYIRARYVETLNADLVTPYDPGIKSLWLADAPVMINSSSVIAYDGSTVVGGFPGFVNTNLSGANGTLKIAYNKSCSNLASCNNLGRIVGGDGVDSYVSGVFYANTNKSIAFARCFTPITCPSNSTIKLSNAACP